jgi:hypothetical protein
LRPRSGSRRIEDDGIEPIELGRRQRVAIEVPAQGPDART